jgi:hypothetical protein
MIRHTACATLTGHHGISCAGAPLIMKPRERVTADFLANYSEGDLEQAAQRGGRTIWFCP